MHTTIGLEAIVLEHLSEILHAVCEIDEESSEWRFFVSRSVGIQYLDFV